MDLSLGRRADYAIRAAVALASVDGRRKAREIAQETSVPVTYLPHILAALTRAGVVSSTAGRSGGYTLARPAHEVSLLDVVNAVDGDPTSTHCVLRAGPCGGAERCVVHVPWWEAQQALLAQLEAATLDQVVRGRPGQGPG